MVLDFKVEVEELTDESLREYYRNSSKDPTRRRFKDANEVVVAVETVIRRIEVNAPVRLMLIFGNLNADLCEVPLTTL